MAIIRTIMNFNWIILIFSFISKIGRSQIYVTDNNVVVAAKSKKFFECQSFDYTVRITSGIDLTSFSNMELCDNINSQFQELVDNFDFDFDNYTSLPCISVDFTKYRTVFIYTCMNNTYYALAFQSDIKRLWFINILKNNTVDAKTKRALTHKALKYYDANQIALGWSHCDWTKWCAFEIDTASKSIPLAAVHEDTGLYLIRTLQGIALHDRSYKIHIDNTLQARALLDYELGKKLVLVDPPMLVVPDPFTHSLIMKDTSKEDQIFARFKQATMQQKSFYDYIKKQKQIDAILEIMSLSPLEAQKIPRGRRHFIFFLEPKQAGQQFKRDKFCNTIMLQLLTSAELQDVEGFLSKLFIIKFQSKGDVPGELPQTSVTINCPPNCLFLQKFLMQWTAHYKAFDYLRKVIIPEIVTHALMNYVNFAYNDIYRITWPEEPYA